MHANAATALEDYVKPGARVLDVGCGSGYLTGVSCALRKWVDEIGFSHDGTAWRKSRGD